MNDRFRFRVWIQKFNKFIEDNCYPIGSDYQLVISRDGSLMNLGLGDYEDFSNNHSWATYKRYEEDFIIEQCTGLKDENGNLIYEGDIVRIFYDHFNGTFTEKEVIGPVTWECGTWVVNNSLLNHAPEYDDMILESSAVEVIGNLHENLELLETVTNCNQLEVEK